MCKEKGKENSTNIKLPPFKHVIIRIFSPKSAVGTSENLRGPAEIEAHLMEGFRFKFCLNSGWGEGVDCPPWPP